MKRIKIVGGALATAALYLSEVGIALAQTTTTPGVPDTGAGGYATVNMLILGASALVAVVGGVYIARKLAQQ